MFFDAKRPVGHTVTLSGTPTNYVSGVQYMPWNAIQQFSLGNGMTETHGYNDRLQPTSISAGVWAINLYPCPGQAVHCSANNGNILEQDVTTPGVSGLKQTFGYDALNRLTAATEQNSGGTVTWNQSYGYDTHGNRWMSANSGVSLSPFTAVANSNFDAANHLYINGAGYDNTGNQTAIGGFANTFDAESRLTASTINATTASYAYDGEGRRVQRIAGGATTQYVYDSQGNLVAEYSTQVPAVTGTEYLIADHLGSTRMTTDASGACLALHDYLPFGEEIPTGTGGRTGCYGSSDAVRQQFTGKERDSETNLDYFGARYFSGAQGRFTSPDEPFVDQYPSDPQSWNLYSYVRNNPLSNIDLDGRDCITSSNQTDRSVTVSVASGTCGSGGGAYVPGTVDMSSLTYKGTGVGYSYNPYDSKSLAGSGTINLGPVAPSDALSSYGQEFYNQMSSRRQPSNQAMGAFVAGQAMFATAFASTYAVPAVIAAVGGTGATLAPGVLNKVHHIFADAGHNLGDLVEKYGSPAEAYVALERATTAQIAAKGLTGKFEEVINVGGTNVTVRGAVVNGVVKIGTAFK